MIVARIFNVFDLKPTLLGKISWDLSFETVISSKSKFLGRKGFLSNSSFQKKGQNSTNQTWNM